MHGSILAALTNPAAPSFKKLSIPCSDGTSYPRYATYTLPMLHFIFPRKSCQGGSPGADGSQEGAHCRSSWPPKKVKFYIKDWTSLGGYNQWSLSHSMDEDDLCTSTRVASILKTVSKLTEIEASVLVGKTTLQDMSIAIRMSWASRRQTTREEDIAYCLLGIFDVSIPLLYGEGNKASTRLQEEIMKQSDDHSLVMWTIPRSVAKKDYGKPYGLLARTPEFFRLRRGDRELPQKYAKHTHWPEQAPYAMTNKGLQIELPLRRLYMDVYLATLDCVFYGGVVHGPRAIYLRRLASNKNQDARVFCDRLGLGSSDEPGIFESLQVSQRGWPSSWRESSFTIRPGPSATRDMGLSDHYRLTALLAPYASLHEQQLLRSSDVVAWGSLQDIPFVTTDHSELSGILVQHIQSNDSVLVMLGGLDRIPWQCHARLIETEIDGSELFENQDMETIQISLHATGHVTLGYASDQTVPRHQLTVHRQAWNVFEITLEPYRLQLAD